MLNINKLSCSIKDSDVNILEDFSSEQFSQKLTSRVA